MKILAILSVYLFGFGYVCQEATQAGQFQKKAAEATPVATAVTLDAPVLDVVLDTIEISVTGPVTIADATR
ncbi:hypothetical protein I2I11_11745 [Pontibacter sp. 172403-2]|uniref:hypothetical protein n=1 Tax=Pontibacter rufus TaxID=2791028 RepID=UPI0018AFE9D2|nr:hypothetical protein [Pontibacter sp. 172403-2]MBF9253967.1 hypothetical protein [Pontibacter sp. 172403-2]